LIKKLKRKKLIFLKFKKNYKEKYKKKFDLHKYIEEKKNKKLKNKDKKFKNKWFYKKNKKFYNKNKIIKNLNYNNEVTR
jgi:hypothetical protein